MAITTIQWTWRRVPDGTWIIGYTFNPWIGCLKIALECKHCYAEGFALRWGWDVWGPAVTTPRRVTSPTNWKNPLKWNRDAQAQGHRRSVFCASLADVFEEHPDVIEARERLWVLIEQTPWLNWLLLTKRPQNILKMSPWGEQWPDHVWVGTSAGTQRRADDEIGLLLDVPAAVHIVSVEPQLEFVNLRPYLDRLGWVICGGESGPQARPFDLAWARDLRDQCHAAHVPFYFKQVGGRYHHSGGRLLDGRTWDDMPPERPTKP
jgi:protein gp37